MFVKNRHQVENSFIFGFDRSSRCHNVCMFVVKHKLTDSQTLPFIVKNP